MTPALADTLDEEHRARAGHSAQSAAAAVFLPNSTVTIPWGRGLGKTWAIRVLGWYAQVARYDGVLREGALTPFSGVRIVHLMPTFKQARDVYEDLVWNELQPDGEFGWLGARINRTTWQIRFPGGSWIKWFGCREANASRGLRCDVVTTDETDDIEPDVIDSIVKPWFSEPWSLRMRLGGGTPRQGRYGLLYREHKRGLEKRKGYFSFHATYRDAPSLVSQEYVEQVKADTPPATFAREWECDFDASEGLVYGLFDEAFHVKEPPEDVRWTELLVGVDHGYEDPGVFLVIGVRGHGDDAELWILDEVYAQHQVEEWWVDQARAICADYPLALWYGDPSRPDRLRALKNAGCRIRDAQNDILDGVNAVANKLFVRTRDNGPTVKPTRFARLYVHPRCVNTIREFGSYRRKRDPHNADHILEDIEDANNHAMDALRYPVLTHFGRPRSRKTEASHDERQ